MLESASLLRRLVSPKGSERNFARQSSPIKLRKVGFVLLQLGKLHSERFNGFALKWSTYLHFRGVADEVPAAANRAGTARRTSEQSESVKNPFKQRRDLQH